MGNINIRTDLAVELNEAVDKSDSRYSGVIVREHIDKVSLVKVTTLEIINEEGEKLFNRKAGIYITIEGIADEIDPGVIIVIDALAARNTQRLNKTIQISNRGINPGSGVGNHRTGITSDNIGVPVIAVGVPTVIDAATIIGDVTKDYENIPKHLSDMYVTPKDIDENIRITAEIIAESINELVYA